MKIVVNLSCFQQHIFVPRPAELYFIATSISLGFTSRKEKYGASFNNFTLIFIINIILKNCISLKLHNLKLRKQGCVCNVLYLNAILLCLIRLFCSRCISK